MSAALHIEDLALGYAGRDGFKTVVDGLSLDLAAGRIVVTLLDGRVLCFERD